ncbi:MAG: alkaline phosphatase family protein [Alphaproteobacteria bacterium]
MAARVLVIGLDGADGALVERYCRDGVMPTLAGLLARGTGGRLVKRPEIGDDASWTSFATGRPLGDHGRYHGPNQMRAGQYEPVRFRDTPMVQETFWDRLSRRGAAVGLLDVPKCPLSPELNGFQVNDWLVHGRDHPHPVSTPASLAGEVVAAFGDPPESPCKAYSFSLGSVFHDGYTPDSAARAVERLARSADMKANAAEHYLRQRDWDLFATVFKELHCAGHLFWDCVDPAHPDYDPDRDERFGRPLETLYRQVDAGIARLLAVAGPDDRVLVLSPHGMRLNWSSEHIMPAFCERLNRALLPRGARLRQDGAYAVKTALGRRPPARYGCAESHVYQVSYNESGAAFRINLQGREPRGKVAPGAAYARTLDRLETGLRDLRFEASGKPVMGEMLRMQMIHGGGTACTADLPDLVALWSGVDPGGAIFSPSFGRFPAAARRIRPGYHSGHGFFVAVGDSPIDTASSGMPIERLSNALEDWVAQSLKEA